MSIQLNITTPNGKFIDNREVDLVTVQTIDGEMGIMGHMIPIKSVLTIGTLSFRDKAGSTPVRVHVHRGILDVSSSVINVITERLYLVDDNNVKIATPAIYK